MTDTKESKLSQAVEYLEYIFKSQDHDVTYIFEILGLEINDARGNALHTLLSGLLAELFERSHHKLYEFAQNPKNLSFPNMDVLLFIPILEIFCSFLDEFPHFDSENIKKVKVEGTEREDELDHTTKKKETPPTENAGEKSLRVTRNNSKRPPTQESPVPATQKSQVQIVAEGSDEHHASNNNKDHYDSYDNDKDDDEDDGVEPLFAKAETFSMKFQSLVADLQFQCILYDKRLLEDQADLKLVNKVGLHVIGTKMVSFHEIQSRIKDMKVYFEKKDLRYALSMLSQDYPLSDTCALLWRTVKAFLTKEDREMVSAKKKEMPEISMRAITGLFEGRKPMKQNSEDFFHVLSDDSEDDVKPEPRKPSSNVEEESEVPLLDLLRVKENKSIKPHVTERRRKDESISEDEGEIPTKGQIKANGKRSRLEDPLDHGLKIAADVQVKQNQKNRLNEYDAKRAKKIVFSDSEDEKESQDSPSSTSDKITPYENKKRQYIPGGGSAEAGPSKRYEESKDKDKPVPLPRGLDSRIHVKSTRMPMVWDQGLIAGLQKYGWGEWKKIFDDKALFKGGLPKHVNNIALKDRARTLQLNHEQFPHPRGTTPQRRIKHVTHTPPSKGKQR